jgi:dolichyl-diphosphooligosaccharide--protein glycosyltransferase
MPILVTVSVNLTESVSLRDLQQFVEAAERNGADPDVDLREYDDDDALVGLSAVGELESDDADDEEGDADDEEGDADDEEGDADDEEGDADDEVDDADEGSTPTGGYSRQS